MICIGLTVLIMILINQLIKIDCALLNTNLTW